MFYSAHSTETKHCFSKSEAKISVEGFLRSALTELSLAAISRRSDQTSMRLKTFGFSRFKKEDVKLRGGERERERERELTFEDPGKCVGKLFWPRSISPVTNLGFWLHNRKTTKII